MVKSTSAPFHTAFAKTLKGLVTNRASDAHAKSDVQMRTVHDIADMTQGLVSLTEGHPDGWPSNDVPLIVMYSSNIDHLTRMRRSVQAAGVRFLGYDRTNSLIDALSVLVPVAVLIDEDDSSAAYRLGRQILADDFTMTLVRLTSGAEVRPVSKRRKAVGALGEDQGTGPFAGEVSVESTPNRLVASFGRLGILPRRLSVIS